jgi:hypothetical protein
MNPTWIPHVPRTWPAHFGTLRSSLTIENGRTPSTVAHRTLQAGTRVRIVMVSQFGDVGITDDLTSSRGYVARVSLQALTHLSTNRLLRKPHTGGRRRMAAVVAKVAW